MKRDQNLFDQRQSPCRAAMNSNVFKIHVQFTNRGGWKLFPACIATHSYYRFPGTRRHCSTSSRCVHYSITLSYTILLEDLLGIKK
jgi:hypothetical protein